MSKQRVFIAGHRGMVGSAIKRQLEQRGDVELVLRTRDELNLLDSRAVHDFFASESIDQVYLAAAKVGGIVANNTYPADFIYQNMMIESNIIHAAHQNDVNKLLFLGSSCIYPKLAKQPMAESELLQGTLEPTNEPYAIAKIAGMKRFAPNRVVSPSITAAPASTKAMSILNYGTSNSICWVQERTARM